MFKVFQYELKRLLWNKFFLGMLVVTAFYSYQVMGGEIILGVANTAPFSPWSFGMYLGKVLPILLAALLFFLSFLYSLQEQAVQVLTNATPVDPVKYGLVRYSAVTLAFILLSLVPIGYGLCFYKSIFHFNSYTSLVGPLALAVIPAFLLVFGLGLVAGGIHPTFILGLIPVMLLFNLLPVLKWIDLCGVLFFQQYPASLGVRDPSFSVSLSFGLSRLACCVLGAGMIGVASALTGSRTKQRGNF